MCDTEFLIKQNYHVFTKIVIDHENQVLWDSCNSKMFDATLIQVFDSDIVS